MTDMTVANTILQQLGGRMFLMMTGSYNLLVTENSLSMKLRRNSANASGMRITLMPSDTYKIEFYRIRNMEVIPLEEHTYEDVYFDMLQEIFTKVTGLYTSL
jgi:hypothetical protein